MVGFYPIARADAGCNMVHMNNPMKNKSVKIGKKNVPVLKRNFVLGIAVLCLELPSFANLITNGSFESGNFVPDLNGTMSLSVGATDMTGWTVANASLAWIGPSNPFGLTASDGGYFLDLSGYHDNAPYAGVEQTLPIPTIIGDQYQLSLDLGTSTTYDSAPVSILVNAGSASTTFTSTPSVPNGWETFTFDFIATSSSTSISLAGQSSTSVKYIGLDNVNVEAVPIEPAPEPGTFALFAGLGLLGLVGGRRFRKA
jgi:hypothetical protein